MSNRTIGALIILVAIAGLIIWLTTRNNDSKTIEPVLSVSAFNKTKNVTATNVSATAGDEIVYTLTAENHSDEVISGYVIEANIADIASKVTLGDAQGASFNSATNSLVWTPLDIPENGNVTKQFTVKVNPLPAGVNNDLLKIKFNNQLDIAVVPVKTSGVISGGSVVKNAPQTGATTNIIWALALISTMTFGAYKYFTRTAEIKA